MFQCQIGISRGVCSIRLRRDCDDDASWATGRLALQRDAEEEEEEGASSPTPNIIGEVVASPFAQVWLNGRAIPATVSCKVSIGDVLIFGSLRYCFRVRRVTRSQVVRILPSMNGSLGRDSNHSFMDSEAGDNNIHASAVILRTEFSFSDPEAAGKAATQILNHCRLSRDESPGNHLRINPFIRPAVSGSFEETLQLTSMSRSSSMDEEDGGALSSTGPEDPLLRIFLEELKSWCYWLGCKIRINIVKNVVLTKNKKGQVRRKKQSDILTFTGSVYSMKYIYYANP